jgi:hypothetical protein
MLGDHAAIVRRIRDREVLRLAASYGLHDRSKSDWFYNPFELDHFLTNDDAVISEVSEELANLDGYEVRPAFAYYPPKTDLCYRRMIYIPFKDLIVRYAFTTVIADMMDDNLGPTCFANRRARGKKRDTMLLAPFALSAWPQFCQWQSDCMKKFNVLLRTDISAFYDSVSHAYLVDEISHAIGISNSTPLMRFFEKLLAMPVISYNHEIAGDTTIARLQQGLTIGNSTDGFWANVYLKSIDETMMRYCERNHLAYGRYNDDIRIFAESKTNAKDAILVLQERLLTKGLNLNVTKTKIAENFESMKILVSKDFLYEYDGIEDISSGHHPANLPIDHGFDELDQNFDFSAPIEDATNAKEFCRHLHKTVPTDSRSEEHIRCLSQILLSWPASGRYAVWLLAETAASETANPIAKASSISAIIAALMDPQISSYIKYRIFHHLMKVRQKGRFIDRFSETQVTELRVVAEQLVLAPALELNVGALYFLASTGTAAKELRELCLSKLPRPIAMPILSVLVTLSNKNVEIGTVPHDLEFDLEPDTEPSYY